MGTMKAIVKENEADFAFSTKEISIPYIQPDEFLVQIKSIGVGIHDGYFFPQVMEFPYPIGIEAAGVIEKVGSDTEGFRVGERVAFVSMMQAKGGTWAEYAAVSSDSLLIKIPDDMSFTTAAAIPVAGNTVLKAFNELDLKQGDTLFIAGASGAIGTFAIQLAKQLGVQVASSASLKNHEYMRSLGADFTVDYHDFDWQDQVKKWNDGGVDAALAIQPGTGETSMVVVKDGGVVVPVSDYQLTGERNISVRTLQHNADIKDELEKLMNQIATNEIQLTIEKVYPFEEALDALHKTMTRHAQGKLVIDLSQRKI
ncbi:quinone oxidoreductase family protein [Sporosarcina sp. FA9]|uniref:quinone oxidoreductase family protein n=1 Tax=Sporosarcina sp. FA9 TaxID=3413030 RepID=UPI003F659942